MGKKGVEDMIADIEDFVEGCKYQPLSSNKIVVPKDELIRMLNELKLKLPSEIERCKKIMRNKEAILASARTRSDAIISESVNEANRLVEQNHITELANARANEILESARAESTQLVNDAKEEATQVRTSAMLYTRDKISEIKGFLQAQLEAENENYKMLIESLESGVLTLDTNLSEVQTSLNLISNDPNSVLYDSDFDDDYGTDYGSDDYSAPVQTSSWGSLKKDDGYDDEDEDDDDYDDDFDDDDDDFLDE